MSTRKPDPARLDVATLAANGGHLEGEWAAEGLERWRSMQTPAPGATLAPVHWAVRGELRRVSGQAPQVWLHLTVRAVAVLTCQRCLQPFNHDLAVERSFRFAADEREAEVLDADSDDDVLALAPSVDLRGLVEDELLLAWPIVPRHEICSLPAHDHEAGQHGAEANPFAALAALKARPPAN